MHDKAGIGGLFCFAKPNERRCIKIQQVSGAKQNEIITNLPCERPESAPYTPNSGNKYDTRHNRANTHADDRKSYNDYNGG